MNSTKSNIFRVQNPSMGLCSICGNKSILRYRDSVILSTFGVCCLSSAMAADRLLGSAQADGIRHPHPGESKTVHPKKK